MFKLILSLALVAVVVAGPFVKVPKALRQGKIVGGVEAKIEDFPYQVSFRFFGMHICGGSVLDENTILTAAHCTDGLSALKMTIMVGSDDIEKGDIYQVASFIQHPQYNDDSTDYDVSLLKLSSSIKFSDKVAPIALQEEGEEVPVGSEGVISGWGGLFQGDEETPIWLRETEVNIISRTQCQNAYPLFEITERMICAQRAGRDSCQGDSGGPFVVDGRQVGIVSWGIGCAHYKYPGVYSKISNLRPWIEANK